MNHHKYLNYRIDIFSEKQIVSGWNIRGNRGNRAASIRQADGEFNSSLVQMVHLVWWFAYSLNMWFSSLFPPGGKLDCSVLRGPPKAQALNCPNLHPKVGSSIGDVIISRGGKRRCVKRVNRGIYGQRLSEDPRQHSQIATLFSMTNTQIQWCCTGMSRDFAVDVIGARSGDSRRFFSNLPEGKPMDPMGNWRRFLTEGSDDCQWPNPYEP